MQNEDLSSIDPNSLWGCSRYRRSTGFDEKESMHKTPVFRRIDGLTCLRTSFFPYANLRDSMELEVLG